MLSITFSFCRLNAHLSSIVSSKPFQMPLDVVPRTTSSSGSRLSSFGFSGTIAHGAFEARKTRVSRSNDSKSLYRNRRFAPSNKTRLDWLLEAPGPQQSRLDEAVVFSGALSSSAEALFSHHVVGGTIILPGVGYVEMAFAASSGRALAAVAFLRPCVLSGPGRGERSVLRCTRRAGALEIASARGTGSSSFATCFAGTLANIENGHTESISGREFGARMERLIKASSRRRNTVVPHATLGPRPWTIRSNGPWPIDKFRHQPFWGTFLGPTGSMQGPAAHLCRIQGAWAVRTYKLGHSGPMNWSLIWRPFGGRMPTFCRLKAD